MLLGCADGPENGVIGWAWFGVVLQVLGYLLGAVMREALLYQRGKPSDIGRRRACTPKTVFIHERTDSGGARNVGLGSAVVRRAAAAGRRDGVRVPPGRSAYSEQTGIAAHGRAGKGVVTLLSCVRDPDLRIS